MPLREAIAFVNDCLTGFGVRQHIKIIASGKVLSGFHLVKNMALGADLCNSARGMMLALGCIHSLICNTNRCPTGVATQDPKFYNGLVVSDKAERVARFHENTVHATAEVIASGNLTHTEKLNRSHIYRRINQYEVKRYDQIFPYLKTNCLQESNIPDAFILVMEESRSDSFEPRIILTRAGNECVEIEMPGKLAEATTTWLK
jgi:hypothetical protein